MQGFVCGPNCDLNFKKTWNPLRNLQRIKVRTLVENSSVQYLQIPTISIPKRNCSVGFMYRIIPQNNDMRNILTTAIVSQ